MMIAQTQTQTDQIVSSSILQGIIDALCNRPGDTAAQRDARSRDVIESVNSFAPRDSVETMLAGLAIMHAHLILNAVYDLSRERDPRLRGRINATIATFDRALVGFLRELRIARKRNLSENAREEAMPEAAPRAAEIVASVEARIEAAKPKPPATPSAPPQKKAAAEPQFPPSRRAETSVAAMLAAAEPAPVFAPYGNRQHGAGASPKTAAEPVNAESDLTLAMLEALAEAALNRPGGAPRA